MENILPFISIIIPTFNEAHHIERSLQSLLNQSYPRDHYEIIVVDNSSSDNTCALVRKYPVKLMEEPRRSAYAARNNGIGQSGGEFIAFIDADCIAKPDWLSRLVNSFVKEKAEFIAGKIEYIIEKFNFANQLMMIRYSQEQLTESIIRYHSVAAGNMLVKKSIFTKLGLFNENVSCSDTEFSQRAFAAGVAIFYEDKAVVKHICDLSDIRYLFRSFEINRGYEMTIAKERSLKRIVRVLILGMPWRPGYNRVRSIARILRIRNPLQFLLLWLYTWVERIFAYLGSVWGYFNLPFKN